MPSSYTSSLRLVLPVTGELTGTWGDTVNNGLTELVEDAIAGTAAITMTDANLTLSTANEAADQARCMFIVLTGTLSATRDVVCPAVSKLYFVHNNTTGGQSITFKTPSGSGITVLNGQRVLLYCNGTNVILAGSLVYDSGDQTIAGTKTFSTAPIAPTAAAKTSNTAVATNEAVDRLRALLGGVSSGTLTAADRGCLVQTTAGVTVPSGVFAAGDVVTIANTGTGNVTITQGASLTMHLTASATTGNRTLAQKGVATVIFLSATVAIITGSGLT